MSEPTRKAGLLQLSFMIYRASCAGAFGVEEMISGCGPGLGLLIMVVVPFLFCLPIAFAVGELTAAFPVEGGNYRWSRMAFGDFWGFQAAWWLWMTGVLTNVIFAVLFANYFQQLLPAGWAGANPGLAGFTHWLVCRASNALLLNVTMLAVSRIPLALAEDGFLPGFLKRRHPVYGTPIQSLFWGSVTYSALTLLDFSQLLIMNS
jgi:amino acid transporter